MNENQRGGVTYRKADASYFERRSLRRFAGVWSLWALGVGAVISGDFFGWNFGLLSGGFGGLLVTTVIVASILTLFLNAGIAPGAAVVGASEEPLLLAFRTIFGEGAGSTLLALAAVAGLVASFHAIIYAYGRNIYSLARAGYFPTWMSRTHSSRNTPHVALFGDVPVGGVLLNMAVFGAVIAYIMQMAAYLRIKSMTTLDRPYLSPLGRPGAIVAGLIAALTLVFLFVNPDYRPGIYGVAVWFALSLLYFGFYARHHMVLSPEEEFAQRARDAHEPDSSRASSP